MLGILGLTNRAFLENTVVRFRGEVDCSQLQENVEKGPLCSLNQQCNEDFFHSIHSTENLEEEQEGEELLGIDFGEDDPHSICNALDELVNEAQEEGLSDLGTNG